MGDVCPCFTKTFSAKDAHGGMLTVTAMGFYEARLNGIRIGDYVFAPGWTSYEKRLQCQTYDVSSLLREENTLEILVGKGWYRSPLGWCPTYSYNVRRMRAPAGLIAEVRLETAAGVRTVVTDESWAVSESMIRFSEIYDGERADATFVSPGAERVRVLEQGKEMLIPQEGEITCEIARIRPKRIFRTPKGELVADFVQNVAGYPEFTVDAKAGDRVELSFAEALDKDGNFYNVNYGLAKAKLEYVCRDGKQTYRPHFTFFGFRYVRLDCFPAKADPENLVAVALSAPLRRIGSVSTGVPLLNRFLENVIWTQRNDHLEVPLDSPQRSERLGWTGDANLFFRAASLNFDVRKFYRKWLADLAADQMPDGDIPAVIPNVLGYNGGGCWQDAVTMIPWQMYETYGDTDTLRKMYPAMKRYLAFIAKDSKAPYLWTGKACACDHCALDAPKPKPGEDPNQCIWWRGASREDFVNSAFYYHSCEIVIRASRVLGEDASEFESLRQRIKDTFQKRFPEYTTQTECILALAFGLAVNREAAARELADRIRQSGGSLQTGIIGTAYALDVLSENGYTELAYDLLLREDFPSWLYMVNCGATTVWEHWDSIEPDGNVLNRYDGMNSLDHYVLGACMEWLYTEAAGIRCEKPGYAEVRFAPKPDARLGHLEVKLETRYGLIESGWYYEPTGLRVEIATPTRSVLEIFGKQYPLEAGRNLFFF